MLYFYPKDNTPRYTTEACEFRDSAFAFREAGATILGISVDDVESQERIAKYDTQVDPNGHSQAVLADPKLLKSRPR